MHRIIRISTSQMHAARGYVPMLAHSFCVFTCNAVQTKDLLRGVLTR